MISLILLVFSQDIVSYSVDKPFNQYIKVPANGFQVYVSPDVKKDKELYERVKKIISNDTASIKSKVPVNAYNVFRQIRIFIEYKKRNKENDGAAFFSPVNNINEANKFMADRKSIPQKLNSIEFATALVFAENNIESTLLHELGHAYHYHVVKFDNFEIKQVYTQAKDRMYFGTGHKVDDYAMKNEYEYFADLTSGFFGVNSSGKITREWLKENDPEGYKMIEKYYKINSTKPIDKKKVASQR